MGLWITKKIRAKHNFGDPSIAHNFDFLNWRTCPPVSEDKSDLSSGFGGQGKTSHNKLVLQLKQHDEFLKSKTFPFFLSFYVVSYFLNPIFLFFTNCFPPSKKQNIKILNSVLWRTFGGQTGKLEYKLVNWRTSSELEDTCVLCSYIGFTVNIPFEMPCMLGVTSLKQGSCVNQC